MSNLTVFGIGVAVGCWLGFFGGLLFLGWVLRRR